MNKNIKIVLVFCTLFIVLTSQKAYAYLDPGTGSMIVQIIIASICGLVCTTKMWFNKVLNIFRKKENDDE